MNIRALGLLAAVSLLTACLTADGVLAPDGSATLTLSYVVGPKATEADSRKMLEGPKITIDEFKIDKSDDETPPQLTAKLSVATVTDLATVPLLQLFKTTIEHTKSDDGGGSLAIRLASTGGADKPDDATGKKPIQVRLTLPGDVTETSGKSDGAKVEWTFRHVDLRTKGGLAMTASYAAPASDTSKSKPE